MNIPDYMHQWFAQNGWQVHDYQQKMVELFAANQSTLLIAPTGSGKTLASFLPTLIDIHQSQYSGLHTLYISPLKALANDIKRNLINPIDDMQLAVTVETRTGDTSSYHRQRQQKKPPNILLTTPESLMLLLSYQHADKYFSQLKAIIIDETHHLAVSKRGDLLSLAMAELTVYAPLAIRIGLSATVANPELLAQWLTPAKQKAFILNVQSPNKPHLTLLNTKSPIPYSGFMANYAIKAIYQQLAEHKLSLIFVNTRAQAEFIFQQLWLINKNNYPIALYHGSLNKEQRLKTEQLTTAGEIKAIVATSALELGIDWGTIDLVIQIGAPHGVSRLLQRIGRSNHQFNKPSKAKLVPANCFEALECMAAIEAIAKGELDSDEMHAGSLDVVVQFIINCACSRPVNAAQLYKVIRSAYPYRHLKKEVFKQLLQFAVDGGYTLKHYEQYHRLLPYKKTSYQIASVKVMRRHRQNIGTIIEAARVKVKILNKKTDKIVGDIEEGFAQQLAPGDTFIFAGEILEYIRLRDMMVETRKVTAKAAKLPSYSGGAMPLSTYLADTVRQLINKPAKWHCLPPQITEWLLLQKKFSALPGLNAILVEKFSYKKLHYLIFYSFEGRRANYTLGMLLSRRMEDMKLKPLNFTATDYGLAISAFKETNDIQIHELFAAEIIQSELEKWLQISPLLKRTFRQVAIIAGLTERQLAGKRKTLKQVTFSTDLIYDVLQQYEPEHILLAITRHDVTKILLDMERLTLMMQRFAGRLEINALNRPSPFSVPILTTFKTESIRGEAEEQLLSFAEIEAQAATLIEEVKQVVK